MSNHNKTLAEVQPGGKVRLGDRLPPLPYPNYPASKTGLQNNAYTASQMWDYARAALSAQPSPFETLPPEMRSGSPDYLDYLDTQPSPGGQDALAVIEELAELNRACAALDPDYKGPSDAAVQAAIAALAARQPVGEPVVLGEADPIPCAWSDEDASSLVTLRDSLRRIIAGTTTKDAAHFLKQPGQRRMTIKDAQEIAAAHLPYVESLVHRSHGYTAPPAQAVDLGAGVKAIADERERQLQAEGFTRDSDEQYREGELARAATAYLQLAAMDLQVGSRKHIASQEPPFFWPWAPEWWKPVDARRDLVRAGALIAAQIDLIDSLRQEAGHD